MPSGTPPGASPPPPPPPPAQFAPLDPFLHSPVAISLHPLRLRLRRPPGPALPCPTPCLPLALRSLPRPISNPRPGQCQTIRMPDVQCLTQAPPPSCFSFLFR